MRPASEDYAWAARTSYRNLDPNKDEQKKVVLNGHPYKVFAYRESPSGFHATAYRQLEPPYGVVIAYRGTDPDFRSHTLTGVQDVAVDTIMVANGFNPQEADARSFTQAVLEKAARQSIPRDLVTVTGHSMGGTLAQIEAWRFGLRGETFNAYGAAELGIGVPEGGSQVIDNVLAGDPVSACSRHFGQVRVYATPADVASLRETGYLDGQRGLGKALATLRVADHGIDNWAPDEGESVLTAANEARAERYASVIATFRQDTWAARAGLHASTKVPWSATWSLARVTEAVELATATGLHAKAEGSRLGRALAREAGQVWAGAREVVQDTREVIAHAALGAVRHLEEGWAGARSALAQGPRFAVGLPTSDLYPAPASGTAAPRMPAVSEAPRLDDRGHPASGLYAQAFDAVKQMEARHGLPGGPHSERVAGALTVAARREGLQRIDRAEPSADRGRVIAVQGELRSPSRRLAAVDAALAANTPLERSSAEAFWAQAPDVHQPMPLAMQAVMHSQAR
ncbi:XVIPCD domain-containing protein [Frateuria sp. GZRR35]|uniref:XVIPCD domain-containing protein n=1 Tax=Frateuria sp. GZRR35 TaxID=3351536 RepID=UPI003EDBD2E8